MRAIRRHLLKRMRHTGVLAIALMASMTAFGGTIEKWTVAFVSGDSGQDSRDGAPVNSRYNLTATDAAGNLLGVDARAYSDGSVLRAYASESLFGSGDSPIRYAQANARLWETWIADSDGYVTTSFDLHGSSVATGSGWASVAGTIDVYLGSWESQEYGYGCTIGGTGSCSTSPLFVTAGTTVLFSNQLQADVSVNGGYGTATADYWNTADIGPIVLTPDVVHVSAVPEPAATWSVLFGGLLLPWCAWVRETYQRRRATLSI